MVADGQLMAESLPGLDLSRARLLAKLGSFWLQRSRDLSSVLQQLLGVQAVWCDTRRWAQGCCCNFICCFCFYWGPPPNLGMLQAAFYL